MNLKILIIRVQELNCFVRDQFVIIFSRSESSSKTEMLEKAESHCTIYLFH